MLLSWHSDATLCHPSTKFVGVPFYSMSRHLSVLFVCVGGYFFQSKKTRYVLTRQRERESLFLVWCACSLPTPSCKFRRLADSSKTHMFTNIRGPQKAEVMQKPFAKMPIHRREITENMMQQHMPLVEP